MQRSFFCVLVEENTHIFEVSIYTKNDLHLDALDTESQWEVT